MKISMPQHVSSNLHIYTYPKTYGVNAYNDYLNIGDHNELEAKKGKSQKVTKHYGSDFLTYQIDGDPPIFKDVMTSSKAQHWKNATIDEMDFIVANGT